MGYIERIPSNVNELEENLKKLYENKSHIKSVNVNTTTSHIEVALDFAAHHFGGGAGQDFYIPIKRAKLREAKELIDKMLVSNAQPTPADAQLLFDMIDPAAK